jgi:(S)-citramalyl-CoA lyase
MRDDPPPRRSLLFAPGNRPELFAKAFRSGADVCTIDWEDAIAPRDKEAARRETLRYLATLTPEAGGAEIVVRLNSVRTREGIADLHAILGCPTPPRSVMLPKVRSPDEVRVIEDALASVVPDIRLHVIIETNEGLESCPGIARASPRIDSLLFGGVDMAAELRVAPTFESLLYARSRLVHAAATAGLDLIDVPFLDLSDPDGLVREATQCAKLGMTGKAAIHPGQIPAINRIFSPSEAEVMEARRIVEEFERAASGLVVVDGKLIEKPVLRSMRRILAIARRLADER